MTDIRTKAWRHAIVAERDRLRAENEALRGALRLTAAVWDNALLPISVQVAIEQARKVLGLRMNGGVLEPNDSNRTTALDTERRGEVMGKRTIWEAKYQGNLDADPWERLLAWTPEFEPAGFRNDDEMYGEGDERATFFSEAYLYNLLGKEDARTLQALLRQAMAAAGAEMDEVEERVYAP